MLGFDRFTERAQEAATRAYEIMLRYKHTQLDTEHLLLALLEEKDDIVSGEEIIYLLSIDNGMITNTFELLTDVREKLGAELEAANAKRDFFLSQADLTAAIYGGGAGSIGVHGRIHSKARANGAAAAAHSRPGCLRCSDGHPERGGAGQ